MIIKLLGSYRMISLWAVNGMMAMFISLVDLSLFLVCPPCSDLILLTDKVMLSYA